MELRAKIADATWRSSNDIFGFLDTDIYCVCIYIHISNYIYMI